MGYTAPKGTMNPFQLEHMREKWQKSKVHSTVYFGAVLSLVFIVMALVRLFSRFWFL